MKIVVGIDPGLDGAVAAIDVEAQRVLGVHDMPTIEKIQNRKTKREVDAATLIQILDFYAHAAHCWVEQIGAMPGQGVTSMFRMGEGFGIIKASLAATGIPHSFVAPVTWKKAHKLGGEKDQSRLLAMRLYPAAAAFFSRKKDADRAEAVLIADYGSRQR